MDWRTEITELHDFFAAWFRGEPDLDFERVAGALEPSFRIVGPSGSEADRDQTLDQIRGAFGREPGLRIEIEAIAPVLTHPDVVIARYVEVHRREAAVTRRHSTAGFVPNPSAPCGVGWLHVHETWLEG